MKQIALITGATSGIGKASALLLAKNNFNLILTGRRLQNLKELESEIAKETDAETYLLNFDIRSEKATEMAIKNLPEQWKEIDILINNAGLAVGFTTIQEGIVDDWERMIDTNIKGLLYISKQVTPFMIQRNSGHIINISSIAGKETYPMGNVYCATKHAVQSISQGMRLDLLKHGIKVSSVCPGAVDTEFSLVRFKGNKQSADAVYKGYKPLYAEDIAEIILFILQRPSHVCIDDILIMPTAQGLSRGIHKQE